MFTSILSTFKQMLIKVAAFSLICLLLFVLANVVYLIVGIINPAWIV